MEYILAILIILGLIMRAFIKGAEKDLKRKRQLYLETASTFLNGDFVIVDVETTGLLKTSQIVEISIIDTNGEVLIDTLIKPKSRIGEKAMSIHGITNEMVKAAPKWPEVYESVKEILESRPAIAYNAEFDDRLIQQTCAKYNLPEIQSKFECAMHFYSSWINERNPKTGQYKWKKLQDAATTAGVSKGPQSHRSLGDCFLVLGVLKYMQKKLQEQVNALSSQK